MSNYSQYELEIIEDQGQSLFDLIMRVVENWSNSKNGSPLLGSAIEKVLLLIERWHVDVEEIDTMHNKLLINCSLAMLKNYYELIKNKKHWKEDTFFSLYQNLENHKIYLFDLNYKSTEELQSEYDRIKHNRDLIEGAKKVVLGETINFNFDLSDDKKLKELLSESIGLLNFNFPNKISDNDHSRFDYYFDKSLTKKFKAPKRINNLIWDFEFEIRHKNEYESLRTLWIFLESINQIGGVKIILEHIAKGSIKAKAKAFFENEEVKKNAQEILQEVPGAIKAKLQKEGSEVSKNLSEKNKNEVETEKLAAEAEKIKKEGDALDVKQIKERSNLETELLRIKVENEKIELENKRLNLFKNKYQTLKELLADEIITAEIFKIKVNELVYIDYSNDSLVEENKLEDIIDKTKIGDSE